MMPALNNAIKVICFSRDSIKWWFYLNILVGMLLKGIWKDFFFFFDVWSVFVAFNDDIFKWVTQCAKDITMDLRFFFLAAMDGNERHSGILLLILFKENKITTA